MVCFSKPCRVVEQIADQWVEKGTTLHKPIRDSGMKRGGGRKPLQIQDPTTNPVHMASSSEPPKGDSFSSEPSLPLHLQHLIQYHRFPAHHSDPTSSFVAAGSRTF